MFVTTYRYRVQATKLRQFLELQRRAEVHYQGETGHRVVYLRSTNDRCQWMELHFFVDETAHSASLERWQQNEALHGLWEEFKQTLDPLFPAGIEEFRRFSQSEGQAGAPAEI